MLPLEPDGFLADLRIRRPGPPLTLGDVDAAVAALADPRDHDGVTAFAAECRQALAALRLQDRERLSVGGAWGPGDGPRAHPGLTGTRGGPAAARLGPAGQLGYEALAARLPHPAYPTSPGRLGFSDAGALRYAPEHRPRFELNWVAVPRDALVRAGAAPPAWWPRPADVGLPPSLAGTHDLLPVHPLTAQRALARALAEAGLTDPASAGPGRPGRPGRPGPAVRARQARQAGRARRRARRPGPAAGPAARSPAGSGPAVRARRHRRHNGTGWVQARARTARWSRPVPGCR